jgi:chaperonin cofactor prefoldin
MQIGIKAEVDRLTAEAQQATQEVQRLDQRRQQLVNLIIGNRKAIEVLQRLNDSQLEESQDAEKN